MKKFYLLLVLMLCIIPRFALAQEDPDTTAISLDSLDYSARKIIYNIDKEQIKLIEKAFIRYHNSYINSDSMNN